jgi:hypothetical protein
VFGEFRGTSFEPGSIFLTFLLDVAFERGQLGLGRELRLQPEEAGADDDRAQHDGYRPEHL